jgi:hypothetical protein
MGWKFDKAPNGERWIAGNPPAMEVTYISDGEDNQLAVEFHAKQQPPYVGPFPATMVTIPLMVTTNTGILHRQSIVTNRQGFKHYELVVTYGPKPLEAWSWQGTTAGGTVKVKVGRHIRTYGVTVGVSDPDTVSPNTHGAATSPSGSETNLYEGLINWKPGPNGGEAEGVDIVIGGIVHFDFFQPVPAGFGGIDKFFRDAELVGKLNRYELFGGRVQPGELLYLGGDYPDGRYTASVVTHHFARAKNLVEQLVEGISGVTKKGWEVAWVQYEPIQKNGYPAGKPVRVHIEQVYEYDSNFQAYLGVPTDLF